MATIHQVHLRIQELSKEWHNIPVSYLLLQFATEPEVIHRHLQSLLLLAFISDEHYKRGIVRLTMHGRLTIPPQ